MENEQPKITPEQMERVKQIRKIHWKHRTPEQKEEYEKLKPLIPKPTPEEIDALIAYNKTKKDQPKEVVVKEVPYTPPQSGETITLTKEGLMKMLDDIRKDEREGRSILHDNEWQEYQVPKQRKYVATLKVWQRNASSPKGLVVDWRRNRFEHNRDTGEKDEIFDVTIRYDDGSTEVVEMPIIDFARFNEVEHVEIDSIKEKKMQMKQGEVRASRVEVDDAGVTTIMGDVKTNQVVPLIVTQDSPIATIKRKNGETLQIPINRLNQ